MKEKYTKDLTANSLISDELFVIKKVEKKATKSGDDFYRLEIGDKTGSVNANIWNNSFDSCDLSALEMGNVVSVSGKVDSYREALQIIISSLKSVSSDNYNLEDFMLSTDKDVEELWSGLMAHISGVIDTDVKGFLEAIFSDEKIAQKFKTHPAAEFVHHAFQSGLLEHVMEMLDLSDVMYKYYPMVDMSLVKAGIILHDIGKLVELENKKVLFSRSNTGYLKGHIIQSYEFLLKHGKNLPEEKLLKLQHIVLSHHGKIEFGSPVLPMTIEAAMVSKLDEASSLVRQYQRVLSESTDLDESFSSRDYILGTKVYLD